MRQRIACAAFLGAGLAWGGQASAADAGRETAWDTRSDTWAAVDALGRELPGEGEAPPRRDGRFVGVFYYLWLGAHGYERHASPRGPDQDIHVPGPGDTNSPYVIEEILRQPVGSRAWGPRNAFHHWGEPLFGFYVMRDEWVIRKHAQMLADADVDMIAFDATNALHYRAMYMNILRIFAEIRAAGGRTPAVTFLTNASHVRVVRSLYEDLYAKGLYRELWFMWKGRPLLMASPEGLDEELTRFFSLRRSWAWSQPHGWFGDGRDRWPWLDHTPQRYGWHESPERPEQVAVATAEHPDTDRGKSFHDGANPKPHRPEQGLYFAEQWRRALEVDPELVFITQWNEWIAMRFTREDIPRARYAGETAFDPEALFVDVFNREYNRDIEPMRGGYGDNYYYQMWQSIRRYKGVRPLPPASGSVAETWDGCGPAGGAVDPWAGVEPLYVDDRGDTFHRNHFGYGRVGILTNATGRNDIRFCRVARSRETLWFRAECVAPLTPPDGDGWMTLHVGLEGDARPAWQGFAFRVQPMAGGEAAMLFSRTAAGTWQACRKVVCRTADRHVVIAVPRAALGLPAGGALRLRFKWSDAVVGEDPLAWWVDGDAAPNGRAAYRYHAPEEP